jgi:hypothetical protein
VYPKCTESFSANREQASRAQCALQEIIATTIIALSRDGLIRYITN